MSEWSTPNSSPDNRTLGRSLAYQDNATLGGSLAYQDNVTLSGSLAYKENVTLGGNQMFQDNVTLGDNWTYQNSLCNSSAGDSPANYDLYTVLININNNYYSVYLPICLIGNIATMVIIRRMRPMLSSSIFILVLAILDVGAMLSKFLGHRLITDHVDIGTWGCRVILFLTDIFSISANWVIVSMTIERFLAVWFPLKIQIMSSPKKAFIVVVVIFLVFSALKLPNLWTIELIFDSVGIVINCGTPNYPFFESDVWNIIDTVFYAYAPLAFIFIFNGLIVFGLQRAMKQQKNMSHSATGKGKDQNQITRMLLLVSMTFLVTTLPYCVLINIDQYWNPITGFGCAQKLMVTQVIYMLADSIHFWNFFLYVLTGTKFRRAFMNMFICKRSVKDGNGYRLRSTPSTNVSTVSQN